MYFMLTYYALFQPICLLLKQMILINATIDVNNSTMKGTNYPRTS